MTNVIHGTAIGVCMLEPCYEIEYTASVTGEHYYCPGRMYMPNGDPGYPEEDEVDITHIEVTDYTVYDMQAGEEVSTEWYTQHASEVLHNIKEDITEDNINWDEEDYDVYE